MYVTGALIVIGFFVALIWLALNNKTGIYTAIVTDMISAVKYSFVLIVGYYWGSSKGSSEKNELLKNS